MRYPLDAIRETKGGYSASLGIRQILGRDHVTFSGATAGGELCLAQDLRGINNCSLSCRGPTPGSRNHKQSGCGGDRRDGIIWLHSD